MIIAIDFDGTLVDHCYPRVGEPVSGAAEWIKTWLDHGAQIFLWTMRAGDTTQFDEAKAYALSITDKWIGFNENPGQVSWAPHSKKQYAHVYVDDAAFGCPLIHPEGFNRPCVDWSKVGPGVLEMLRPTTIKLTKHEIQSNFDRVKFAEGLIRQLPENHDGRNTWLLNYGAKK